MKMVDRLMAKKGYAVAVMAGYAGTGKSYLLRRIAEVHGVPTIVAPTGAAAARIKEVAGLGASTIHRWLYKFVPNPNSDTGTFNRKIPDEMQRGDSDLVIVDEASMVGRDIHNDIDEMARMLGLKILYVGDPFQLPPVEEESEGFCLLDPKLGYASEYVLLDEIVRQAQDSYIIKASMMIRAGDVMGAMAILPKVNPLQALDKAVEVSSLSDSMVVVHKNSTRFALNERIRKLRGFEGDIQAGEPIMVVKNNYQLYVYNGERYKFLEWLDITDSKHAVWNKFTKVEENTRFGMAKLQYDAKTDFAGILAEEELYGRMQTSGRAMEKVGDIHYRGRPFIHANLGYVLTCHKAQASQANDVLVVIEPGVRFWGNDREQSLRWIYTGITRAINNCTISLGIRL